MYRKSASFSSKWISAEQFLAPYPLEGEEWVQFNTFRGVKLSHTYRVSNKGRVQRIGGPILKGSITFDGYHEVQLIRTDSSNQLNVRVHRIVLELFKGPAPSDMKDPTVHHLNHDKLDNRVENLCWVSSYRNNQEGHARRCKIVDDLGEHIFNSQKLASKYIGRYEDYISEGIHNGYVLKTSSGHEVTVYVEQDSTWVHYSPGTPKNKNKCILVMNEQSVEFPSFLACDRFLEQREGYVSTRIANNWPILDQEHQFFIFNRDSGDYVEYIPSSKKRKSAATKCRILQNTESIEFLSVSALARYIGRDPEYVRVALKEGRPLKDCNGQLVCAEIL